MEMSARYVSDFSGSWFFSNLSEDLGQHSLGEKIRDSLSFKCAKIMDGLLSNSKKEAQSYGNPRTGTTV